MNEKRFIIVKSIENLYALVDKERADKDQILILSLHKEQLDDVVVLLNDQQSTINKQDEEIKKLKRTERSWRKIHCCNKESDNCGIVIEQQSTISRLEEEKEYWKNKAMTLLMQVRRLTPRMTDKEVMEFAKELE